MDGITGIVARFCFLLKCEGRIVSNIDPVTKQFDVLPAQAWRS